MLSWHDREKEGKRNRDTEAGAVSRCCETFTTALVVLSSSSSSCTISDYPRGIGRCRYPVTNCDDDALASARQGTVIASCSRNTMLLCELRYKPRKKEQEREREKEEDVSAPRIHRTPQHDTRKRDVCTGVNARS